MSEQLSTLKTPRVDIGFTLIELLMGITVLGLLLAIGIPSFSEMVRNNRTTTQVNEFVSSLSVARSEAMKRGMPVSICAANEAQTACAGADAADWANGWLIFTDRLGNPGVIDEGDEILQRARAIGMGLGMASNDVGFVRFGSVGRPTEAVDVSFDIEHESCSGNNRRVVAVQRTGRVSTRKDSCT